MVLGKAKMSSGGVESLGDAWRGLEEGLRRAWRGLGEGFEEVRGVANHHLAPPLHHSFDLSSHTPLTPPKGEESVDYYNYHNACIALVALTALIALIAITALISLIALIRVCGLVGNLFWSPTLRNSIRLT